MNKEYPKVSIVILNYNGYQNTLTCIDSLKKLDYPNFEIIVVDNNSPDSSGKRLRELKDITFTQNRENLGYSGGNNVGIQCALQNNSNYVLILNNDTVVRKDFLSSLMSNVDLPDFGICGCKIVDSKNKIWFAGGFINQRIGTIRAKKNSKLHSLTEVTFITGCMLFIKREVFEKIGLFDERYFMYFEDAQFCYRAIEKGFKLYYNPNVEIVHSISEKRKPFSAYFTLRNRQLFIKEQLQNALLPRVYFYSANYLKIALFWLIGSSLYKSILTAIRDFKVGKTGNTFSENLYR